MKPQFKSILYIDLQDRLPAGFCPVCRREVYGPGMHCLLCERRKP